MAGLKLLENDHITFTTEGKKYSNEAGSIKC